MNKYIVLIILSFSCFTLLNADLLNYDKVIKNSKGIKNYNETKFSEASETFKLNALENPNESTLQFNLGNAQFKSGELEAAEDSYNLSLRDPKFSDRSAAMQNLGSIKFQQKQYPDAIKYFRDALIENPHNEAARHNYEVTSRLLQRQQNKQQQQQQNPDDQKKSDEKDKNDEQKQSDQNDEKQDKKDQQQQQKSDKKDENQQQEEQQKLKKAEDKDKQDADKILKALMQKEREEQEKKKEKLDLERPKIGKYW